MQTNGRRGGLYAKLVWHAESLTSDNCMTVAMYSAKPKPSKLIDFM